MISAANTMLNARSISRAVPKVPKGTRTYRTKGQKPNTHIRIATHPYAQRRQQHFVRSVLAVTALGAFATTWQWYSGDRIFREVHAEEPAQEQELAFEKPRRKPKSKEDNRDLLSSQHLQVKKSWENPGLYAWGSNTGKVVAPDSDDVFIKSPRRIPFFDGMLLRDIKLDRNFGAAIDEKGDLLQWGTAFSKDLSQPTRTLTGKNLASLTVSRDRIIALSTSGTVYSIPVSQAEQQDGPKPSSSSWIPFWSSSSNISHRTIAPSDLSYNEKVTTVTSGLEHALLLTSKGRLFSFASGSEDFPTKGQLGIPGLTWQTRPSGSYDQPHEITTLRGFQISKIAVGDFHSLAADTDGRVFTFGDNTYGQLGFDYNPESTFIDAPSLLPFQRIYSGTSQIPRITNVFAGGNTSFFTVDATKTASPDSPTAPRDLGRVTADTFACGFGLTGQLGTGRWTHIQTPPTKIPSLSGLFEYDETRNTVVPIRLSHLSVGASHAAAIMSNIPNTSASHSRTSTENDTNWGRDVVFFGNNEFYQLGTGKRSNLASPGYIQPLDQGAERERAGLGRGEREMHRFQITPRTRVRVAGRDVEMEQRVECGRGVTAVYSGV